MSHTLELLILIRKYFEEYNKNMSFSNGICDCIRQMYLDKKLCVVDRNYMLTYLEKNRPGWDLHAAHYQRKMKDCKYWFEPVGGYESRIAFLDHLIKLQQAYETISDPVWNTSKIF